MTAAVGEQPQGADTIYAGVVTRTIALAIDALIINAAALLVTAAVFLVESILSQANGQHPVLAVIGAVVFFIWVTGYFVVFWTTTGQTPGSRVMHIRVVREDGASVRRVRALARLGGMVISLPLFWGYLPILTNDRRRGVPDVRGGTVVIVTGDGPNGAVATLS